MSKSVFMQLEMAAGLRASFQHAAAREHRPAAQVLQRLMREYVVRQPCVDVDAEAGAGAGAFDPVKRPPAPCRKWQAVLSAPCRLHACRRSIP